MADVYRTPGTGRGPTSAVSPAAQEAYRQMADNEIQWNAVLADVAAEMNRLREENARLRTVVRTQEVALADWERSYPNVTTEATEP